MRPTDRIAVVEGNLPGETIAMGFDPGSIAHIMGVLTDLYSNPVAAVVREYSTNARDSHIAAGVTDPIQVELPTPISQFFRVKDVGLGLSVDDIRNIYAMYGASTKRDTDTQTGMLGLGCKSALTLTNQFTLSAVKDGKRVVVSISRATDGTGSMTIVHEEDTDDRNGVEITIPVSHQDHRFKQEAEKFFSFWPKGTVELIGGSLRDAVAGMDEIEKGIFVNVSSMETNGNDWIVMGNVAYPLKTTRSKVYSVIAFVEIGDVHFTPSREALQYTPRTNETIEKIFAKVEKKLAKQIENKIKNCATFSEAMQVFARYSVAIRSMSISPKYKGVTIPGSVGLNNKKVLKVNSHYGRSKHHINTWDSYTGGTYMGALVVPASVDMNSNRRAKVARWCREQNIPQSSFLLVEKEKDVLAISPFLDGLKVYHWDDVKVEKIVGQYGYNIGKQPVTVTYYDDKTGKPVSETTTDGVNKWAGKTFVHYSSADKVSGHTVIKVVETWRVVAVELNANRHPKLSRETGSKHITAYIAERCDRLQKEITQVDKIKRVLDTGESKWYDGYLSGKFNVMDIDDDDVRTWLSIMTAPYSPEAEVLLKFGRFMTPINIDNPLNKYPLLSLGAGSWRPWTKENVAESIIYMNAAYAARKDI